MFLVLEGIDGAGTTTQTQALACSLRDHGHATHCTREPSDGPIGKLLRQILTGQHAPTDATTLGLLFAADRADHLQREILPALANGNVVISDRYYYSSLAYQGSEEERSWIEILNQRAMEPTCTFFLRVDPLVAAKRRSEDKREDELFDALETQKRVARGYDQVMDALGQHEAIQVIDGSLRIESIKKLLLDHTLHLLAKGERS